ncbi:hypothetical protein INR49_029546 [Caranx melampygus]|nr:hypothetical protein INR49_029546 [Caranx melampygus]
MLADSSAEAYKQMPRYTLSVNGGSVPLSQYFIHEHKPRPSARNIWLGIRGKIAASDAYLCLVPADLATPAQRSHLTQ